MSDQQPHYDGGVEDEHDEDILLNAEDAAEEIEDDGDAAMDSGDEDEVMEEIQLVNDSVAHFDLHKDSIFCIAQHPIHSQIVATGGSEGDDADGMGYIWDSTPPPKPVLPVSYQSDPTQLIERESLQPLFKLEGHTDSINALEFTLPSGEFLTSAGLDGKLRVYSTKSARAIKFLGEVQEVEEINWLAACPHPSHPNTIALGANDGSVWVYTVDGNTPDAPLQIVQTFYVHTASCTAGAWTPDGKFLATVSEDSSLYVWDVFGEAAAAGLSQQGGQTVVALTEADQRFFVEGGLYSVAVAPSGSFLAVGGAGGSIKIVGLPRIGAAAGPPAGKAKGGKVSKPAGTTSTAGQAGQILADLQAQGDGIETLAFAPPPLTLLAAGSVDGSVVLYDTAHRFAVRRNIKEAHEEFSVVKVEFVKNQQTGGWLLTSCGLDGVVKRWDTRGGTAAPNSGFISEWRGHRGDGEGGGVLGFVQGDGNRIVTAGDDGVALVFDSPVA